MRAARQSVTVPGMDFGMGFNLPANTVAEIETLLRLAELWGGAATQHVRA